MVSQVWALSRPTHMYENESVTKIANLYLLKQLGVQQSHLFCQLLCMEIEQAILPKTRQMCHYVAILSSLYYIDILIY